MLRNLQWIVKASKFCNLRCTYCYEWDELADTTRMSLELWRRLFIGMQSHLEIEKSRGPHELRMSVVLHGGEPLALPVEYLEEVMSLCCATLPEHAVSVAMQTNLYRLTDRHIEFLQRHRIRVGVSLDVIPGVRRTLSRRASEPYVIVNIRRLRAAGIDVGAIAVLARHTASRIIEVYEFFARENISLRILPLFEGPPSRPDPASFAISNAEIVAALERLFAHWMQDGAPIAVKPLIEYYETTLRKVVGTRCGKFSRRRDGENVFIVNTNGDLYTFHEDYAPEHRLGNLSVQTLEEIFASEAYACSFARDEAKLARFCTGCEYNSACDGSPLFATDQAGDYEGRCPIAYPMYKFLESWTESMGVARSELIATARSIAARASVRQRGPTNPI